MKLERRRRKIRKTKRSLSLEPSFFLVLLHSTGCGEPLRSFSFFCVLFRQILKEEYRLERYMGACALAGEKRNKSMFFTFTIHLEGASLLVTCLWIRRNPPKACIATARILSLFVFFFFLYACVCVCVHMR